MRRKNAILDEKSIFSEIGKFLSELKINSAKNTHIPIRDGVMHHANGCFRITLFEGKKRGVSFCILERTRPSGFSGCQGIRNPAEGISRVPGDQPICGVFCLGNADTV